MGLRVYLQDNDGAMSFIDYGLEGKNYKAVIRTEIREEKSKVKTFSGSKWVGIPEIDEREALQDLVVEQKPEHKSKKKTNKIPQYEIFDYKVHDTDREYYWVSTICSNCLESTQVAIPRNQKIDKRGFKCLSCPKCSVEKSLHHARYDHGKKKYIRILKK